VIAGSKALFLDLDMTLADTSRGLMIAFSRVGSSYGAFEIPVDTDPRAFMKAYYREAIPGIRDPMEKWLFWRSVWMRYLEERIYGRPAPCSESLLLAASGKYITAIVTGREIGARAIVDELESYGFPIGVIRVYTVGDLWLGATKRDLYEQLAAKYSRLGVSRSEVVVVTDSPRDVQLARGVGFNAIGYIPFGDQDVIAMLVKVSRGLVIDTLCVLEEIIARR